MSRTGSMREESRPLHYQGHQIAMRVAGEGPPLLLVNGMTRPMQSWGPLTRELTGRTVITFDAPGVGGSPTSVLPLSMAGHAAVAVAVLDAAGAAQADVLGFSHGGAVAQELARANPERVRRLVLVSTSCGVGATPSAGGGILRALGTPVSSLARSPVDALGLLWHAMAISSWSSISFLGAIGAPTLVVSGSRDSVVPPANSRVLARRIPGSSLVILSAGHDLQRADNARTLAPLVENFLRSARPTINEEELDHG